MHQYYPLNPVVTSNAVFASLYNEDVYSSFLTSACVSPSEFDDLVASGAQFESVVLVNGAGQETVTSRCGKAESGPRIEYVDTANIDDKALIPTIHGVIGAATDLFDVAG